jgi:hypothetical protein
MDDQRVTQPGEATTDIRMVTTIAWIAGPTIIFIGWFLMSLISGSQRVGGLRDQTSLGLVFLFAVITSFPLIVVSLIGGGATMLSDSLRTQRVMNVMALCWNAVVFAIYFGLIGIVGTLQENGFPVTPVTVLALIPIALITTVLPIVLFVVNRRRIHRRLVAAAAAPAPVAVVATQDTYDI